jgi:type I restriction enzyme R subunit
LNHLIDLGIIAGMIKPEQEAREKIEEMLAEAGWEVCNVKDANIYGQRGIAIREFPLKPGYGFADYLLYIDGRAAGVIEAKKAGTTLTGVETQSAKYSQGLPENLPAWHSPLPFTYQSTGIETRFTNGLDPGPCSRQVFSFHRPETLAEWIEKISYDMAAESSPGYGQVGAIHELPLRHRLRHMPPLIQEGLWPAQIKAIKNLSTGLRRSATMS